MKTEKPAITTQEVRHIADLGRLGLTETELEKMTGELQAIVGYVEELERVATDDVEATSQVTGIENALQPDVIIPSLPQAVALNQAPVKENGFFKVKAVL